MALQRSFRLSALSAALVVLLSACGGSSGNVNSGPGSDPGGTNDTVGSGDQANNPDAGNTDSGSGVANEPALLGSKRGGHVWAEYCADQPDHAVLPADPRELVNSSVGNGKAVVFNIEWETCFINDEIRPSTCGEYRELHERGRLIGRGQGEPGTAHMFSGSTIDYLDFGDPSTLGSGGSLFTIAADDYNNVWQTWTGYIAAPQLPTRPENFDELVAERYGSVLPEERNPYPLPGEDPNQTNGGSGQLPVALTQLREPDGTWTGQIGVKLCSFCHDGGVDAANGELGPIYGGAGTIGDFTVAFRDFAAASLSPTFGILSGLVTVAANRGTGAIDQFQVGFIVFNGGTVEEFANEKTLFSGAIGNIKSPAWWNMGSRVHKFHGATLSMDSSRIDMAAYYPLSGSDDAVAWVDGASYPFQIWAESLKAPEYPGPINEDLAKQGAILFHAKNLWASNLNNPAPQPEQLGNGSCASCHGAYSPKYVNDPQYLDDPRLEGIAANVVRMDVIRTDPTYAEAQQSLRSRDGSINEGIKNNVFTQCGLGAAGDTPNNAPIMLAPPLYGVWASAPYFHNASVPNIWGVLDPDNERPNIWERVSKPAPQGLEGRVVMGFDTNFERAYDQQKLGWRYKELDCISGFPATQPLLNCNPISPDAPSLQDILGALYQEVALLWNLPIDELANIPLTDQQIETRKVFNTNIYSQGNQGHDFTAVLTDAERRAIIEYLKTL